MKTTIVNPKQQFLLGAGLDILHFESREWLDSIAFWKDEIRFFDELLKRKETSKNNDPDFEQMLKSLNKIHKDLFDDLEDRIIAHERLLARLEKGEKGLSDAHYRSQHQNLFLKMNTFTNDFKSFKKIVFDHERQNHLSTNK